MPIRLIAIDIDGTLLDSRGQLPQANRNAILNALDVGIEIALVTGRTFQHAQPIAAALSEALILIVNNGALVKRLNGETLDRRLLNKSLAGKIITITRPIRRGAAVVFDRSDSRHYVFERVNWNHPNRRRYYERNKQFMTEVAPLEKALIEDPAQIAFTGSVAAMHLLAKRLREFPAAQHVSLTLTDYKARDFSLLDITVDGCSKGSTLKNWSIGRGIDATEVMAVGDNLNDLEMLEFAGYPVVMENAVPELKVKGWHITQSHDENGLATAIQNVALGLQD